jgi:ABC-type amino acid transport substrate-binding protein
MRRPLAVGLALLLSGTAGALADDLDDLKKKGVLRVLVVEGSPAFISLEAGSAPGFERDLLDGFARREGLRVTLVEVAAWEDLVPSLLAGKGDVIAGGVNDTADRRKVIDFTSEVFPTRDVVLTRRPTLPILTLDELRQVKVGTIKGTALADRVIEAKVPRANVDDTLPATGFAEALRTRRVVAVVDGIEDALLLKAADPELDLGMFLGPPASMAFGVRKDQPALRDSLSAYVAAARKSGTWSRLVIKYFGGSAADVLKKTRAE